MGALDRINGTGDGAGTGVLARINGQKDEGGGGTLDRINAGSGGGALTRINREAAAGGPGMLERAGQFIGRVEAKLTPNSQGGVIPGTQVREISSPMEAAAAPFEWAGDTANEAISKRFPNLPPEIPAAVGTVIGLGAPVLTGPAGIRGAAVTGAGETTPLVPRAIAEGVAPPTPSAPADAVPMSRAGRKAAEFDRAIENSGAARADESTPHSTTTTETPLPPAEGEPTPDTPSLAGQETLPEPPPRETVDAIQEHVDQRGKLVDLFEQDKFNEMKANSESALYEQLKASGGKGKIKIPSPDSPFRELYVNVREAPGMRSLFSSKGKINLEDAVEEAKSTAGWNNTGGESDDVHAFLGDVVKERERFGMKRPMSKVDAREALKGDPDYQQAVAEHQHAVSLLADAKAGKPVSVADLTGEASPEAAPVRGDAPGPEGMWPGETVSDAIDRMNRQEMTGQGLSPKPPEEPPATGRIMDPGAVARLTQAQGNLGKLTESIGPRGRSAISQVEMLPRVEFRKIGMEDYVDLRLKADRNIAYYTRGFSERIEPQYRKAGMVKGNEVDRLVRRVLTGNEIEGDLYRVSTTPAIQEAVAAGRKFYDDVGRYLGLTESQRTAHGVQKFLNAGPGGKLRIEAIEEKLKEGLKKGFSTDRAAEDLGPYAYVESEVYTAQRYLEAAVAFHEKARLVNSLLSTEADLTSHATAAHTAIGRLEEQGAAADTEAREARLKGDGEAERLAQAKSDALRKERDLQTTKMTRYVQWREFVRAYTARTMNLPESFETGTGELVLGIAKPLRAILASLPGEDAANAARSLSATMQGGKAAEAAGRTALGTWRMLMAGGRFAGSPVALGHHALGKSISAVATLGVDLPLNGIQLQRWWTDPGLQGTWDRLRVREASRPDVLMNIEGVKPGVLKMGTELIMKPFQWLDSAMNRVIFVGAYRRALRMGAKGAEVDRATQRIFQAASNSIEQAERPLAYQTEVGKFALQGTVNISRQIGTFSEGAKGLATGRASPNRGLWMSKQQKISYPEAVAARNLILMAGALGAFGVATGTDEAWQMIVNRMRGTVGPYAGTPAGRLANVVLHGSDMIGGGSVQPVSSLARVLSPLPLTTTAARIASGGFEAAFSDTP